MRAWAPAALLLLVAACGGPRPGDPPVVRYGSDVCARCGMIVSEERFASGYIDERGNSVVFDDVGEFLQDAAEHPAIIPISFVHDAQTGRWLRAAEARFVEAPGLATPMGSGFAALSDEARAAAFARRLGREARACGIAEAVAGARRRNAHDLAARADAG